LARVTGEADRTRASLPAEILVAAATKLIELGRLEPARTLAALALEEDDRCANAHSALAVVCDATTQWQKGIEHGRHAVELMPESPQLRYNLALSTLRLDDYPAGFALMEARIDKPDWTALATAPSRAAERHRLLRPADAVEGRRILVVTEQGLGDCIMFARYLPLLAERGARVAVACSPPLRPLFERLAGVVEVMSPPPEQPLGKINLSRTEFDAWVPLLSLARHFATELATVPGAVPYLRIDPQRRAAWRQRFEAAGRTGSPKIGLVYHANPESGSVTDRSVPLADLTPLLRTAAVDFVNLQGGEAGRRLAGEYPAMIDATAEEIALDDFAAAVAATDLLVTVDTMAAHCAGALGHPIWLMAPFSPHWSWGVGRDRTPWYPTARLFRQAARRDWADPLAAIAKLLDSLSIKY
jgi:ADP-heptose:LPS heptosyltransferase